MSRVLGISERTVPESAKVVASLSLWKGGLGLGNVSGVRSAAHWGSWVDCMPIVWNRHPHICWWIVGAFTEPLPFVDAVLACEREVQEAGLDAPPWHELSEEVQVEVHGESEPNQPRCGWQKKAAGVVDIKFFSEKFWPALLRQERALILSQTGPLSGMPFIALPTSRFTQFDPQPFRVPLDPCGHHPSACAVAGVIVRRCYPLESAAASFCREADAHGPGHGSSTCSCLEWAEDLKLLPMVYPSTGVHNWRLTHGRQKRS